MRRDDLHPHRQPVDDADRHRDRRAAVDVGGERERPVVAHAHLDAAERRRQRPLGGERDVGIARRDHEVDVGEDRRHPLVQRDAPRLELAPRLRPVAVHVRQRRAPLWREQLERARHLVAQLPREHHGTGERPRHAEPRQRGVGVAPAQPRGGGEPRRGLVDHRPARVGHVRAAPVAHHDGAQPGGLAGAEPRLPARDARERQRIARLVAIAHVEPPRGVAHATRQAPERRREVAVRRGGSARDAAVSRLEADEAGEARGDADRPTAVAARRERDEAARDRGRAAARRAAGRGAVAPGIVRRAVELGPREIDHPELARRRLANGHRAAVPRDTRDHRGGVRRGAVAEDDARARVRPPRHGVQLLDADRHAAERLRHVGCGGRALRGLDVEMAEGVEAARGDRVERGVELLERRASTRAVLVDERAGVPLPRAVRHRAEPTRGRGVGACVRRRPRGRQVSGA